eukprot:325710_1
MQMVCCHFGGKCKRALYILLSFGVLILGYIILYEFMSIDLDPTNASPTVLFQSKTDIISNISHQNVSTYLYFTNDAYDKEANVCGRLWLYNNHGILLSITNKKELSNPNNYIYLDKYDADIINGAEYTRQTIIIQQMNEIDNNFNCSDITIFVRISGTETIGGLAQVYFNQKHQQCYWFYNFKITLPGKYTVVARMIYFKGYLDFDNSLCFMSENKGWKSIGAPYSNITALYAFNHPDEFDDKLISTRIDYRLYRLRFYDRHYSCCEWCARMRWDICKYWMSGPGFNKRNDRCLMFYDENSEYNADKTNSIIAINMSQENTSIPQWFSGKRRHEETTWYLGSKLSVTPSQRKCFIGNWANYDMIHNSNFSFIVYPNNKSISKSKHYEWIVQQIDDNRGDVPICTLNDIQQSLNMNNNKFGRWVTAKYFPTDGCMKDVYFDEYNETAALNSNYLCLIISYRYMWSKTYRRWPSNIFVPYSCKYQWFKSIQDAIDWILKYGIQKIYFIGDSVTKDMQKMFWKMAPNQLFNLPDCYQDTQIADDKLLLCYNKEMGEFIFKSKPQVVITNCNLLHLLWHYNLSYIENALENKLKNSNEWIDKFYKDGKWPIKMFINSPLILAEREYHVTGDRAILINQVIVEKCNKYGWRILPYFDLTESQMYDSSREGMHPEGPVLLETVRVFFHMIVQYINNH